MIKRIIRVALKASALVSLGGICCFMIIFCLVVFQRCDSDPSSDERFTAPDNLVDGDVEVNTGRDCLIVTLWAQDFIYIDPGSVRLSIVEIRDKNGNLAMRDDQAGGNWRFSDTSLIQVPIRNRLVSSPLRFTFPLSTNGLEKCLPLMKSLGSGNLKVFIGGELYSESKNGKFEHEFRPTSYLELHPHEFTYDTEKDCFHLQGEKD